MNIVYTRAMSDPRFKPLKFLNEEKNESVKVQLISRVTHLIEETLTEDTPSEPPEKKIQVRIGHFNWRGRYVDKQ